MNRSTLSISGSAFSSRSASAPSLFLALKVGNLTSVSSAPGYRLDAAFDNIGGLKLRAPVKAAGVVVGRVEKIKLDPQDLPGPRDDAHRPGLPVLEGHDRLDPDVGPARRGVCRARCRRRHADARRRRAHREDAVGGGAREADRPVHVRQGRVGYDGAVANDAPKAPPKPSAQTVPRLWVGPNERRERRAAISRAAALLSCIACWQAARPRRRAIDPFEPLNRAMYEVHEVVDGNIVKPIAEAYVDYAPQLIQHRHQQLLRQHRRPLLGINDVLQGKPDKAGNDIGRVMINTGFGLGGLIDIASDAGIPSGQRGLRPDLRVLGIPAGTVPVHSAVRAHDGARWHRAGDPRLRRRRPATSPTCRCATSSTASATSTCAPRRCRRSRLVDQAALDRYTFIRSAYLQRRQLPVSTTASRRPTEGRRRMTITQSPSKHPSSARRDACAGRRSDRGWRAAARPRDPPRWRRKRPTRWSSACRRTCSQIIKSDPQGPGGRPGAHPRRDRDQARAALRLRPHDGAGDGRDWRAATPEQQKQLVDEFKTLLVRTYSSARSTSTATRRSTTSRCAMNPAATDVTVRTEVIRPASRRCRSTTAWARRRTAGRRTT